MCGEHDRSLRGTLDDHGEVAQLNGAEAGYVLAPGLRPGSKSVLAERLGEPSRRVLVTGAARESIRVLARQLGSERDRRGTVERGR